MSAQPQQLITASEVAAQKSEQRKLIPRFAERYGVDPDKLLSTLSNTAFKVKDGVSTEQMMALLIVAEAHRLNPFTREIFAFPSQSGIVPVVSVDGWLKLTNEHPQFDGLDFDQDEEKCTCTIYRKDRSHPIRVTEYMSECKRPTGPWSTHPKRMLRHKALIQAARVAFSFAGIYDVDEAERIVEAEEIDVTPQKPTLQLDESGKPEFVNHDGTPHVPGKKISPKKMRELVEAVEAALKAKDGPALLKAISGLDSDGQLQLWGNLRSWDRTAYRELEAKARKADAGMQLDSWSISLLRECENEDALQKAFKAVVDAYEANGVTEVPESVLLVCDEMRMSMGAA